MNINKVKRAEGYHHLTDTLPALESLNEKLAAFEFAEAGAQESGRAGWLPLYKLDDAPVFCHRISGAGEEPVYLLCYHQQEKVVPTSELNRRFTAALKEAEDKAGSPLGKKAQRDLKADVYQKLLNGAYSQYKSIYLLLSAAQIWIFNASVSLCECILATLRKALGSLPVYPLQLKDKRLFSYWACGKSVPEGITIDHRFKVVSADKTRLAGDDSSMLGEHAFVELVENNQVTHIGISLEDHLSCTLDSDLGIGQIRWAAPLSEQNADIPKTEQLAILRADMFLVWGTLNLLLNRLAPYRIEPDKDGNAR